MDPVSGRSDVIGEGAIDEHGMGIANVCSSSFVPGPVVSNNASDDAGLNIAGIGAQDI